MSPTHLKSRQAGKQTDNSRPFPSLPLRLPLPAPPLPANLDAHRDDDNDEADDDEADDGDDKTTEITIIFLAKRMAQEPKKGACAKCL